MAHKKSAHRLAKVTFAGLRDKLAAAMLDGWSIYDAEAKGQLANVEQINRKIFLRR